MKSPCRRCGGSGREPDYVELGMQMRRAREKSGLTVRAVATRLGFSTAYISDLELGRRTCSPALRKRYEQALKAR
jgi:transcriptional regulator with XRE-family HTH domain